jgi:Tfp pilus assembly protein PilX
MRRTAPRTRPRPHATDRGPAARDERGFALVAAVLVLLLTGVVVATYYATSVGERVQAANVHVARDALYAADAGVRTVEQLLANRAKVKLDSLALLQSGSGPVIPSPATFFPAGAIVATSTNPAFSASGTVTFSDSTLRDSAQVYDYVFTIQATGSRGAFGRRVVQSQGILRVSASRGSFADFLIFTQTHTLAGGGDIWFTSDGIFDGRMHTNGEFRFAYKPTFQDLVTSVNPKAWYYNKGNPVERNANSNGTLDVPNFYGGFTRSTSTIDLPANSYSQQNAALGPPLSAGSTTAPTNAQINQALGLSGSSAPPTGVYVPHAGTSVSGGIYVQGSLSQALMFVDTDGNQVYVLKQGSSTDTIRVNHAAHTTTFYDASAGTRTTYSGAADQVLFTNGSVSDLRGPERSSGNVPPAVSDETQLLIAATGDVVVQRDVTVENYDTGQGVLGIFSSGGSVRVGTGAPDNLNLDAYVMATGSSGSFQVDSHDYGSPRGTLHLRGGAVTRYYGAFYTFDSNGHLQTGYGRDFHYDRRGFKPPYYPLTPRLTADLPSARTSSWKEM